MKKWIIFPIILLSSSFALGDSGSSDFCSSKESLVSKGDSEYPIQADWIQEFDGFLKGDRSSIRAFSEAISLRKLAKNPRERAFSEYWISRVLYEAGLVHLAQKGFLVLSRQPAHRAILPFQVAALGCLVKIHQQWKAISFETFTIEQFSSIVQEQRRNATESHRFENLFGEVAFTLFLQSGQGASDLESLLQENSSFKLLISALSSMRKKESSKALKKFESFFSLQEKSSGSSDSIQSRTLQDSIRLLYARALYQSGKYEEAVSQYKLISNRSNEWVSALSEIAWSYLLSDQYQDAIGTAIGLQSGALKKIYAPEALMVMAIALNETCRYPEAMNVVEIFKRRYKDAYFWLKKNLAQDSAKGDYYRQVIDVARKKSSENIPVMVSSEWIRSPLFLSNQDRINLLFKEKSSADRLSVQGKTEQRGISLELSSEFSKLMGAYRTWKIQAAPGAEFPPILRERLKEFQNKMVHYRRMRASAKYWRMLLSHFQKNAPRIHSGLIAEVNQDLLERSRRMFAQMNEILENNDLIEVEIYEGASKDIIWKNAHPDYQEVAKNLQQERNRNNSEKNWYWGTTEGGLEGTGEIWEDEIGALSANLDDNCASKDKYLAIKRKE